MDLSKVGYAFLIILALTLNFGFFLGAYHKLGDHHLPLLLTSACINILCVYFIFQRNSKVIEKRAFRGREILFATGLVASLQLCLAIIFWFISIGTVPTEHISLKIISLSGGALLANIITTCIVILDTLLHRENFSI